MTTASTPSGVSSTGATLSGSYTGATLAVSEVGFYYGTTSNPSTKVTVAGTSSLFSKALTGLTPNTTYYYKAYVIEGGEERAGSVVSFNTPSLGTVTTGSASSITSSSATLSASYSNVVTGQHAPQDIYFKYGTNSGSLDQKAYYNDGLTNASGNFSVNITSLAASTQYYYKVFMSVWNGSSYTEISGDLQSFTTTAAQQQQISGWLELPEITMGSNIVNGSFGTGTSRNYTYHYDKNLYTALWVAYPLTYSHTQGSADNKTWAYNPDFDGAYQIDVRSNSYGTNYGDDTYSRGHQLPAADRKCNTAMRAQTYYVTNQTPQNQNGFNSPMWSNLEDTVRGLTSSHDTVYVVTGAAFRKVGGTETISYLHAAKSGVKPDDVPIPNYYWKVLLTVTRSGNTVTGAKAIGIWMPHTSYSTATAWQSFVVSVAQIEEWTGFDFFRNLPDNLEAAAESISSWSSFTGSKSNNTISSVSDTLWGSF